MKLTAGENLNERHTKERLFQNTGTKEISTVTFLLAQDHGTHGRWEEG